MESMAGIWVDLRRSGLCWAQTLCAGGEWGGGGWQQFDLQFGSNSIIGLRRSLRNLVNCLKSS